MRSGREKRGRGVVRLAVATSSSQTCKVRECKGTLSFSSGFVLKTLGKTVKPPSSLKLRRRTGV
jgi:hypothetical protein